MIRFTIATCILIWVRWAYKAGRWCYNLITGHDFKQALDDYARKVGDK